MITKPFAVITARRTSHAFTLIELLISVAVLAIIIFMLGQLATNSVAVTRTGNKHIDTDTQARAVLDRMAVDFAQMLKRTDVDYYVKAPTGYTNPHAHGNGLKLKVGEQGNDQIAFFSQVAGYNSTSSSWQSPVSLVAYRVNSGTPTSQAYLKLERMGKGLLWNGVSTTGPKPRYPIVFVPGQIVASSTKPPPANNPWTGPWYAAINNDNSGPSTDLDYETIGPQVFRFEYYYLLKDGTVTDVPRISAWGDPTTTTLSANLNAFSDVEAIAVTIAVIDPASRSLLYDASTPGDPYHRLLSILSDMADFKDAKGIGNGAQKAGDVEIQWKGAVQSAAATGHTFSPTADAFPPAAASGIRIYNRYFDLKTRNSF